MRSNRVWLFAAPLILLVCGGAGSDPNVMRVSPDDPVKVAQEKKVDRFLGERPAANPCAPPHKLSDYVGERLRLADNESFGLDVGGGRKLYSGGRPHDYGDTAAYILDEKREVAAVAYMGCVNRGRNTPDGPVTRFTVEIYVRDGGMKNDNVAAFKVWRGYKEVRELNQEPVDAPPNIHLVRQSK